jgi:putative DNA primase/helicase
MFKRQLVEEMTMAVILNIHQKNDDASVKPTVDEVLELASNLCKASTCDAIETVLKTAAEAQLEPLTKDKVLSRVQKQIGGRIKPLRQQLALYEQELGLHLGDPALDLARKIRNDHFHGGAHLVRCADGSYWVYEGTRWRETTDNALRRLILEEANKLPPSLDGNSLTSLVSQSKTLLDDLMGTDADVMGFNDEPCAVVNCANGEVNIDADGGIKIFPHRPESRLTYCLPIDYDPEATCPIYDQTLLEIFDNAKNPSDMVRYWHEFVGYAIQPRRDIASFWMLIGHGSNGKSMLLRTIQRLVGPDAVLNDQIASFQRDRFNLAALAGRLLFIDDDLAEDVILDNGLLKKISEEKEISARHAYGRRKFNFRCLALPIIAGNSYPRTADVSHGLVRRAMVIPFDRVFGPGEAKPSLFPGIWKKEMPGVFSKSLEGLKRLRKRGAFQLPTDARRAAHEFLTHANPLVGFIDECMVEDSKGREYLRDIREVMAVWAADQGLRGRLPGKTLKRKLEGLGYHVGKKDGKARVHGLTLTMN